MSELLSTLANGLTDRYRVDRVVGRGGMATVVEAMDLRHHRRVAIKVLDPQVAGLLSVDRFLMEVRVMAGLQHPHILPLFDSGEVNGLPYYVMPFVEGETLQARIARERRLGVDVAIGIAREIASALDFAHRHGVVHRDVKPANILLSDGHALVADFGIARALTVDPDTAQRLTATGIALGTPGYMSPEQAAGEPTIDGRADIYALGAVVHEMLAGEPPFTGPSVQAILARALTEQPPALTQVRRGVDPTISRAVQRALAAEPSDRFATASGFAEALGSVSSTPVAPAMPATRRGRRYAVAAVVGLLAVGATWAIRTRGATRTVSPGVRVAVIPFRESGDTTSPGFVSGLTATLRGDLATLPSVDVIAGTSLEALGDSARVPRYVAQQLGATHVLSGEVQWQRAGGTSLRVRIVPELIDLRAGGEDAERGAPIDESIDELFRSQARVSAQIAQSLGVPMSAEAVTRLSRAPTTVRAAFEAYLKSRTAPDAEAREYLEQAVALDSNFAGAWGQLATAATFAYRGVPTAATAALARRAATRGLALDSMNRAVCFGAMMYQRHVVRDFAASAQRAQDCVRLAPGDAEAMHFAAAALFNARRFDEALSTATRAVELDPRNASALARLENLQQWTGDLITARVTAGRAIAASRRRTGYINMDSVWLPLMDGNLAAVHAFARSLPDDEARGDLAFTADRDWLQGWALDSASVQAGLAQFRQIGERVLDLTVRTRVAWRSKNERLAALLADSASREGIARLRTLPQEERLRMTMAYAMALGGRCDEAVAQSDTAHRTRSAWHDGFFGAGISLNRAEILAVCGRADGAVSLLDSLSRVPGFVTPGWLRVDPHFASLRENEVFARLVGLR